MTPENFAYWLKGFFEMTDAKNLSPNQVIMIKEHLKLVFEQKTPYIDPGVVPTIPHKWFEPICSTTPIDSGVSIGGGTKALEVKVTCDAPNGVSAGVSTNSNLDQSLLCGDQVLGTTGRGGIVDEHSHAGQAKRMTVSDSGFVDSKTVVTC